MRITLLPLCLLFISCSKPLIAPFTYASGTREVKIDENVYELHVQGPYNVDAGTVRRFFLCRAAELTLQNGGKFFVLLRDKRERDEGTPLTQQIIDPKAAVLDRIGIPQAAPYLHNASPYLKHNELEKQLKFSNTGIIKICTEMPLDAPFYDATLISVKMLPGVKKEKHYEEHRPLFRRLIREVVDLTDLI